MFPWSIWCFRKYFEILILISIILQCCGGKILLNLDRVRIRSGRTPELSWNLSRLTSSSSTQGEGGRSVVSGRAWGEGGSGQVFLQVHLSWRGTPPRRCGRQNGSRCVDFSCAGSPWRLETACYNWDSISQQTSLSVWSKSCRKVCMYGIFFFYSLGSKTGERDLSAPGNYKSLAKSKESLVLEV